MKKIITTSSLFCLLVVSIISAVPYQALALAQAPFSNNSNAIFIPGIEASRLYSQSILHEDQLWEPNANSDVLDLYLNTDGTTKKNVYTRDIIDTTNICFGCSKEQHIYNDFTVVMDDLKNSGKIVDWKPFPYDWRLDMNTTINNGTKQADGSFQKITELLESEAATSRTGKVTLVAHSNGGLFVKLLLVKLQQQKDGGQNNLIDKIDKVIMVATPQYGTPLSVAGLLHGDKQNLAPDILLNQVVARGLGENMSTAYGLVPSPAYFQKVSAPVITFDPSVSNLKLKLESYGPAIVNRSTLDSFFLGAKDVREKPLMRDITMPNILNQKMIEQSEVLHSAIDSYVFPSSIKVYTIAGVGIDTVSGVHYFSNQECIFGKVACSFVLDRNLLTTLNGDGTVITESAVADVSNRYYVDLGALSLEYHEQYDHKNIMGARPVREYISNILTDHDTVIPPDMSTMPPDLSSVSILHISSHSPVSLSVYTSQGQHVGASDASSSISQLQFIDTDILNSSYYEIGEEKYITVPAGKEYSVKLLGLDSGSFTLNLNKTVGDQVVASSSFNDIPVSLGMKADLSVGLDTSSTSLNIDTDGDGKTDEQIQPGNPVEPTSYLKLLKKTILSLGLKTKVQDELFMKIDRFIKEINKGKLKKAEDAVTRFAKQLSFTKRWNKGLTGTNREVVVKAVDTFLDQFFSQ